MSGFAYNVNKLLGDVEHIEIKGLSPTSHIYLVDRPSIQKAIFAIRLCADSLDKSDSDAFSVGPKDLKLLQDCIKKGHESVFEHLQYTFFIQNFSRAMLQEISRHRIASPSVQSTRWSLHKLLNNNINIDEMYRRTGDFTIDELSRSQIMNVQKYKKSNKIKNDIAKYALPESFLTHELLTINCRSMWNLFKLRLSQRTLWEFRMIARGILDLVCKNEHHKLLYDFE